MAIGFKIAEIIIDAGIIQGFFIAFLLIKRRQGYSNTLLSFILVILSLLIFHSYYFNNMVDEIIKSPYIISEPFIFLIGPMFYFYTRDLVKPGTKIKPKDTVHFIPFILYFISFIPVYFHGKGSLYYNFLYDNGLVLTIILWLLTVFQFAYYLAKVGTLTHGHNSIIEEEYSDTEGFDTSWIKEFLWTFLVVLIFLLFVLGALIHEGKFENFRIYVSLILSAALFYISYKGLKQRAANPAKEILLTSPETTGLIEKDNEKLVILKKELLEYIEKNKPYLNPDLTLTELARGFGISRNQLSFLINNELNENFYNFVNKYRVEETKKLIADHTKKNLTLIALAYEAGFNSKSSFNKIFKEIAGLTPSGYRNSLN